MKQQTASRDGWKIRPRDVLFLLALLLAAAGLYFIPRLLPAKGAVAEIRIGSELYRSIDLATAPDEEITVQGKLTVHLIVEDGTIRFADSECPDHVCVNTGVLRRQPDTAVCLPAGVSVSVRQSSGAVFDGIAG